MTTTQLPTDQTGQRTNCPAWCEHHPELEPEFHAAAWDGYGMSVIVESDSPTGAGASIGVDHGTRESLTLTEEQAHELGMELVRTADRLRRARLEAQS